MHEAQVRRIANWAADVTRASARTQLRGFSKFPAHQQVDALRENDGSAIAVVERFTNSCPRCAETQSVHFTARVRRIRHPFLRRASRWRQGLRGLPRLRRSSDPALAITSPGASCPGPECGYGAMQPDVLIERNRQQFRPELRNEIRSELLRETSFPRQAQHQIEEAAIAEAARS